MLMTRYFVLLQLPHAGGEEIRAACLDELPREAFIPNDLAPVTPYEVLSDDYGDLPMFAVVRNPWDWYVAWYQRAMSSGLPAPKIWASALDSGHADFRTALMRACTGADFESATTAELMRELGIDHYSALFTRIVGRGHQNGQVQICRYERLAEDFGRFASSHDVPGWEGLAWAVGERVAGVGTYEPIDYRAHYDEELRDLVAVKARQLIDEHGYEF
jgi:hypothetical protein